MPLRPTVVYEIGPAFIVQNDGRYGDQGTPYEAEDVGQQDNLVNVSRTSVEFGATRHTLILLYAPFEVITEVRLDNDLQFRDERFAAGTVVRHRYLFDGYRSSYLYRLLASQALEWQIGASLQIRNADVAFTSIATDQRAQQDDIGVVFAAKTRLLYRPQPDARWAMFDADAFSTFGLVDGVSGAIYDLSLVIGQPIGRGVSLTLGARLVGGGAKVEEQNIDNWANFVSFTAGARIDLETLVRGEP
ncbi:MAG: hypothetical protein ACKV2T_03765 [Kofleriaceae bacterium]